MSENQGDPRRVPPSTPRWVKMLIIIFIALIALIVILHLTGYDFGGRHMSTITSWL